MQVRHTDLRVIYRVEGFADYRVATPNRVATRAAMPAFTLHLHFGFAMAARSGAPGD